MTGSFLCNERMTAVHDHASARYDQLDRMNDHSRGQYEHWPPRYDHLYHVHDHAGRNIIANGAADRSFGSRGDVFGALRL